MHLGLVSVAVVMVASCVQAASLKFHRSQEPRTIERVCATAQRHAVDARDLVHVAASESILPQQTVLGRCDPDEACCDGSFVRRAVESETNTITFLIKDAVNKDNERYINVTVEDHIKCKCVDVEQPTLIPELVNVISESRR